MSSHALMSGLSMHGTVRWFHATAAARLAEQVVEADVGKRSLQLDTLTVYDLVSASPKIWQACGPGPGGSGDLTYVHTQSVASATWTIVHSLGKFPAVSVVDSAGDACLGDVRYESANQVTISFSAAFAGKAYFN